ncbi:hypothetical protein CFN78_01230 [Amycolatopsis antarctica]|uniref:ESX-1 secretion-associated protein n=1 Tax=Amycolatopsis antarctica TaxID=1854586 RepID=A0A263DBI8_9PSEU|nr:hypothetical protein [Amycolatopsis antarctica]OZM74866.1 hypothetical protein CFN78_01230 [Amycolatopsis antarctica]
MGGYQVDTSRLYAYSDLLAENKTAVAGVKDKVGQADVGDESWGIVGIFVKHMYTDMLGDLNDLLKQMEDGLQSASDKVRTAGEFYDSTENDNCRNWNEVMGQLENSGDAPR